MHNGMYTLGGCGKSPHVPIPDAKWR